MVAYGDRWSIIECIDVLYGVGKPAAFHNSATTGITPDSYRS
jgi:hypothetical protein